ncbi:MAG TPA: hypothetical protein VEZ38_15565, partial [Paenibacillus sp.]|nr:hypothetical protein [Paenibacillus sp.]
RPPNAGAAQPLATASTAPPSSLAPSAPSTVSSAAPSAASSAAPTAPSSGGEAPARPAERPPLLTFLKLLGVDVEREWLKLSQAPPPATAPSEAASEHAGRPGPERALLRPAAEALPAAQTLPPPSAAVEPQPGASAEKAVDTMKSVLSLIAAADDMPPALKEAAQTALQSLTGQQLLMAQDKTAPFAHVTMFVPLKGQDGSGDGNAAVHIHTRRGKKGELDAENCRLWFQLSLAALGETWVDVTVASKVVGLHVWNDHPAAGDLLLRHKEGMEAALRSIGYQLLTFKHSERPASRTETEAGAGPSAPPGRDRAAASAYAPPAYKGVDLRV